MDVEDILRDAIRDLDGVGARWALVGGLAVSCRVGMRFTKDVDFAVAVDREDEADRIVFEMQGRGYRLEMLLAQEYSERASTARLEYRKRGGVVMVDLLFGCTGIEPEIVAAATPGSPFPGIRVPVATTAHLIVMKTIAGRHQDLTDLEHLIDGASTAELEDARRAAKLVRERGFHRDEDVTGNLEHYITEAGR